jgi:GNAT superfamily N-acetyltransferase
VDNGGLESIIAAVEAGERLATQPWYRVVSFPGTEMVLAFPGLIVIVTELGPDWVEKHIPFEDLSLPLNPPFLSAMEEKTGRRVNNLDILMLGPRLTGEPQAELTVVTDADHPRVRRALRYRTEVTAYLADGGVLVVGRGVGGRWEVGVEVAEHAQGRGLGRSLALAARHLVPEDRPIWAQIAPGNATSVRAFLAAGYTPVGAEALLVA